MCPINRMKTQLNKTRKNRTNGGSKVHSSLLPKTTAKTSTVFIKKPKKTHHLKHNSKLKTLKIKKIVKQIKQESANIEYDDSPEGLIKSLHLTTAFVKQFIKKYDRVMNEKNNEKKANYAIFMTLLAEELAVVAQDNADLIDDEELLDKERVFKEPAEYVEDYLDFIDDDIVDDFKEASDKFFSKNNNNANKMKENNNNSSVNNNRESYLGLSSLIHSTNKAIYNVIRNYADTLKAKKDVNIDVMKIISDLTAIKLSENKPNNVKKNNANINALTKKMMEKLGL